MATIGSVNSQQLEFLDDAKVITVTGDNINLRKKPNEWGGYSVAYGNQLAYDFSDGDCYLCLLYTSDAADDDGYV